MNKLVIALGSNIGNSLSHLALAKTMLEELFGPAEASRIYSSKAVDYIDQPSFFNQVLSFELPRICAHDVLQKTLLLENKLGRVRSVRFGPRTIDIDLLFFGEQIIHTDNLTIPHPRFLQRSFVVLPLLELSIAKWLRASYQIPEYFDEPATPVD